jgi:hypothetical protein
VGEAAGDGLNGALVLAVAGTISTTSLIPLTYMMRTIMGEAFRITTPMRTAIHPESLLKCVSCRDAIPRAATTDGSTWRSYGHGMERRRAPAPGAPV